MRCDLASYHAGTGNFTMELLKKRWTNSRIIVGGLSDRGRARSMAHAASRFRVRYLEGCHVKLYIFYRPKPVVILGSMNLGNGMPFEMAAELRGVPATECVLHFSNLWNLAEPVEASELSRSIGMLQLGSFVNGEGAASQTLYQPKPTAVQPKRK